ncbi:MAG TPA: response regulator [archaeon]|nr:response regulator [archaeon]
MNKGTIAYLDDNPKWHEIFADYIEKELGYSVIRFFNGNSLVKEMDEGLRFGLAIVDLKISSHGVDGKDIIREIRQRDKNVPIISTSAWYAMPEGATEHFSKGTPYPKLKSLIKKLYPK